MIDAEARKELEAMCEKWATHKSFTVYPEARPYANGLAAAAEQLRLWLASQSTEGEAESEWICQRCGTRNTGAGRPCIFEEPADERR